MAPSSWPEPQAIDLITGMSLNSPMTGAVQELRTGFHGTETDLYFAPGIRVVRVEHPSEQQIDAHGHDWACLTVYRCGGYTEQIAAEEITIDAPAAVFHPPGRQHANRVGALGLETTSFLFDPTLLRNAVPARALRDGRAWRGGPVARAAQELIRDAACSGADPTALMSRFLQAALAAAAVHVPSWLATASRAIAVDSMSTAQIARRLNLHPAWLARAYLHATGESIQATSRRHKVERALALIRSTSLPLAQIAADVGFCDQSHMVRCFHAVIGRAPSVVRSANGRLS
jgi:AraC family transcriptional regulator